MSIVPCDHHIHTHFSPDVEEGSFRDYCVIAEHYGIQLGFLDHFDITRSGYLSEDQIDIYLEAFDQVKTDFPGVSLGLEVEYRRELEEEIAEFIEKYRGEFDRLIAAVHRVYGRSVTLRRELELQLTQHPFDEIEQEYFRLMEAAVKSRLFDGVAHIDVVYRYVNDLLPPTAEQSHTTLGLGGLCKRMGLMVELNLKGLHHPVGRTYPPQPLAAELMKQGVQIFIGSDVHSTHEFREMIMEILEANSWLRKSVQG